MTMGAPNPALGLDDLPAQVRERIVALLRELEPRALGILAQGSYARGLATSGSDLDLATLGEEPGPVHYRTWFEDLPDGSVLHVSANTDLTPEIWTRQARKPADWAFGFPVTEVHAWLWATDRARELLGDSPVLERPAEVSIEDMVETATKVRRAIDSGDRDGLRFWAHELVRYAAPNLVPLNEPVVVHDPAEALAAMLDLPRGPERWTADVRICIGLDPVDDEAVAAAATRLPLEVLAYVREHRPDVDPQPWVERYLRDGTFERYLRQ